jgi:helicase required for RNAi-mediated heterochromatin assembly 1
MNISVQEKFKPGRMHKRNQQDSMHREVTKFSSNFIAQYLRDSTLSADLSSWLSVPEIPTPEEAQDITEPWQTLDPQDGSVILGGNELKGGWGSKEEYLKAHYEMLREEAVRPLRETISWVKNNPDAREDQRSFGGNMGLYEKACAPYSF